MKSPLIFDLRGFSLDDGPGIRTTIFLKGCQLSCMWCQNPESWKQCREIAFYPDLCVGSNKCLSICPEGAADIRIPGRIDRSRCTACCICVEACPSTALKTVGRYYPPDELVEILLRNRIFYETSGGGVTFSGGEPTLHMDYLESVAKELKKQCIHIVIQTSGIFDLEEFRRKVLPNIDLIYYDLKLIDPHLHMKYTGVSNKKILDNFVSLCQTGEVRIVPRTPLIPDITATEENLTGIAKFIRDAGCPQYELLPYNPGGISKRRMLGMVLPPGLSETIMPAEEERRWMDHVSLI